MPYAEYADKDIYDEAMTEKPMVGFGLLTATVYRVVLIKGKGKEPYQPEIHDPEGRRPSVAIDFKITPIDPTRPLIAVNTMLDWTPEFRLVVRPSLQRLTPTIAAIRGLDPEDKAFNPLRELHGLYVRYQWVPRPGNKEGETWNTICFTEVYPDEAACKEAAKKEGVATGEQEELPPFDEGDEIPFPDDATEREMRDRAALAAFLPGMWEQAQHDREAFLALIGNPPWNKHFDAESKEVLELFAPF